MVESCSAINCTARRAKGVKLKFHRIPKDPGLRQAWLNALRRKNFHPGDRTVICEKHFTKEHYEINVHGNKVLKKDAIQSIFDFPSHLQKSVKERRSLTRIIKDDKSGGLPVDHMMPGCSKEPIPMEVDDEPQLIENASINIDPSKLRDKKIIARELGRNRRDPIYFGDFKESDLNNGETRKTFWAVANKTVWKYKKLVKYYQCKTRRQQYKVKNLNALLTELQKQQKISSEQELQLKESIPEAHKQMLFRQLKKGSKGKFTPELRSFALTLNFYSASAYEYVRRIFGKNSLPHSRTLAKWYSNVDGTPGYSAEALRAIKIKVECEKQNEKQLIAGLMMDEMSIYEHVQWTGSRHVGYVNNQARI